MTPGSRPRPRTVTEGMAVLQPWLWDSCRLPAREVMRLTPRQADHFIAAVLARRSAEAQR